MKIKLSTCKKCSARTPNARYSALDKGVVCTACFEERKGNYKKSIIWKKFWQSYSPTRLGDTVPHAFDKGSKVSICGRVNSEDDHWIITKIVDHVDGCQCCQKLIDKRLA